MWADCFYVCPDACDEFDFVQILFSFLSLFQNNLALFICKSIRIHLYTESWFIQWPDRADLLCVYFFLNVQSFSIYRIYSSKGDGAENNDNDNDDGSNNNKRGTVQNFHKHVSTHCMSTNLFRNIFYFCFVYIIFAWPCCVKRRGQTVRDTEKFHVTVMALPSLYSVVMTWFS